MNIKIERTNKDLSSHAGLVIFQELYEKLLPEYLFNKTHFPTLKAGIGGSLNKFRQLIFGFQAGAECLDDMDKLALDGAFESVCGLKPFTSKTFGNFLRSFQEVNCKALNVSLSQLAFRLRNQLFPESKSITLDIDSTTNEQFGKKMEGVCSNYAGIVGLNTIQVLAGKKAGNLSAGKNGRII